MTRLIGILSPNNHFPLSLCYNILSSFTHFLPFKPNLPQTKPPKLFSKRQNEENSTPNSTINTSAGCDACDILQVWGGGLHLLGTSYLSC